MSASDRPKKKLAAFIELLVCQVGLLFFAFLCWRFFRDPSELLKETGFEELPKSWLIVLGRGLLLVLICGGVFASVRSILNFSQVIKVGDGGTNPGQPSK